MMNRRNYRNHPMYAAQRINERYPDVYQTMMPHATNMAQQLGPRRNMRPAELRGYSQQMVRNSRIMDDPPYGLNERTIRDIAALLLLSALL